ncbi:DEAD/DEAH box helicase [Streptomyces sp. NPDC007070]|uniref:DEAD/DEAH box helicase n=1 Tax=Streptomyces sp. NPDC007070 TaxID=3154312 RepID=UPI0033FA29CC
MLPYELPWDEIEFPHFDNQAAAEIPGWAGDPTWVQRFTHYAEALRLGADILAATSREGEDGQETSRLFEQLGDPLRGVWRGLDTSKRTQEEQGRFLLTEVLEPALQELMQGFRRDEEADAPLLAWFVRFRASSRPQRAKLYAQWAGTEFKGDINAWIRQVAWPEGLREAERAVPPGNSVPSLLPASVDALRRITAAIDARLDSEAPKDPRFDWEAPFDDLLPADIAAELMNRTQELKKYRDGLVTQGKKPPGIDEQGMTELWRTGLPVLRRRLADQASMLLIGPTTTGKTDFSRIAAASTLWQKKKVVVLLPTKALVTQAAEEWRAFFDKADSSKTWKVLEASRDHPYNDEDIARGDYDIVLAIPEKLAAYLAGGSQILDQCGLLVVDELQTLNQRQRGINIESLLTFVKARYPKLPIIGLSATLTQKSSENLRVWLGVGDGPADGFVATHERPVSLDRFASHPNKWRRRSQANGVDEDTWAPPLGGTEMNTLLKQRGLRRAAHRDAIALACRLLTRPGAIAEGKSLLIFVSSRRAAEQVAQGLQDVLEALDIGETATWDSPYYGRFGRLVMTEEEARERDRTFLGLPNLPATQDVREGLSTGVMYHTARLDPEHRRIIEQAFKDKIIRVIVATATLAVGMNLPADYVIVADITEGISGFVDGRPVERLLDPHDMAQRFGRCGRLMMSAEGEAYVLVQRGATHSRMLKMSEEQKEFFARRISDREEAVPEVLDTAVEKELSTLDGVFEYFVKTDDTGDSVVSNLDDRSFARLLLQDICRHSPAVSAEDIDQRIQRIYDVSLLRIEGKPRPETYDLIDILDSEQLIGPAPEEPDRYKITGLGRTVALSNVSISNARGIREVAEAALHGAGPLTLLTIAAQADYVRELTWLALPYGGNTDLVDQVRNRVWHLVRAFASSGRSSREAFRAPEFLDVLGTNAEFVGHGQSATALRGRVDLDASRLADSTLVSHLRACIGLLWLRGFPMNPLISCITMNTQVVLRGQTRKVEAYPADIRDLGERLSYVLNAASEVVRLSPQSGSQYLALKNMAEGLQSGLPYQLAPMLRLRKPRIHRERLATLLDGREDALDFDDLASVLQTLSQPLPSRSAQQKRAHANLGFTAEEQAEILAHMSQAPLRTGALALPPDIRDEKIPSRHDVEGSVTYGRIADDMRRKRSLEARAQELVHVLEEFGLTVDLTVSVNQADLLLRREESPEEVQIKLLADRLDKAQLSKYENESCCLVSLSEISPGAEYALRSTGRTGLSAMTVWVFVAALARIDRVWQRTYFGSDPGQELARRVMSFFGAAVGPVALSDVALTEVAAGLPASPPLFTS